MYKYRLEIKWDYKKISSTSKHVSTATRGYNSKEWCSLCGLCRGVIGGTSLETMCQSRVFVAEAQGQFENPEEEERQL
jgi:hypothetical protein